MASNTTFSFTELPAEIRNAVYKILLCTFPHPDYQDDRDIVEVPKAGKTTWLSKKDISTSILLVSRQIQNEARAVLIKTNLFVQVECHLDIADAFQYQGLLTNRRIPQIAADGDWTETPILDKYKPLVAMTYAIKPGSQSPGMYSTPKIRSLVLHRDFDNFALRLANADDTWLPGFSSKFKHIVTINTDGATTDIKPEKAFLATGAVQERLFAPFTKYFRGMKNFTIKTNDKIRTNLDQDLAARTIATVKNKPAKTISQILAELNAFKTKGAEAFRRNDTQQASENWAKTCMEINRVRQNSEFHKKYVVKAKKDSEERQFIRELAEMLFLCNLNLAQNTIKVMEKTIREGSNQELVEGLSGNALGALQRAFEESGASVYTGLAEPEVGDNIGAGDMKGGWRAANAQMAKLWFRKAKTHRLVGESDYQDAVQAIGFAENAAPGDAGVLAEKAVLFQLIAGRM